MIRFLFWTELLRLAECLDGPCYVACFQECSHSVVQYDFLVDNADLGSHFNAFSRVSAALTLSLSGNTSFQGHRGDATSLGIRLAPIEEIEDMMDRWPLSGQSQSYLNVGRRMVRTLRFLPDVEFAIPLSRRSRFGLRIDQCLQQSRPTKIFAQPVWSGETQLNWVQILFNSFLAKLVPESCI